jgi:hypothetical protein
MSGLRAGIARANVTPPVGMLMSGYASRKTGAVGIHDELYAVVLYLNDGKTEAALVTADIIGISGDGTDRVRKACADAAGVPGENILIAFSHTHGGPQTDLRRTERVDALKKAYGTLLVHKMAGALSEAKNKAVPARVGYGQQDCSFAMNRRERKPDGNTVLGINPEGPTEPQTHVIRFDRLESGDPLAIVFSYASHGTTMGGNNYLYTADYPGEAKRFVDKEFTTATSSFLAGCSGDINPYPRGEFKHVELHGRKLGCAVVQAALEIEKTTENVRIAVARDEFKFALEKEISLDEAKMKLAEVQEIADREISKAKEAANGQPVDEEKALNWFTERSLRGAKALVEALEKDEAEFSIPAETQALAIGDYAIVGMPGEIFVKVGMEVADKSPFAKTISVSHANGAVGYVPTADQIPLGGYEVQHARASKYGIFIAPNSDQTLIESGLRSLQRCYDAQGD